MLSLVATLNRYGASADHLIMLADEAPESLRYASLNPARSLRRPDASKVSLRAVSAVYEWQDLPLMFIVDGAVEGLDLKVVRRALAMRGDAPYMGVVEGGTLRVFELDLDDSSVADAEVVKDPAIDEWALLSQLAVSRVAADKSERRQKDPAAKVRPDRVGKIILNLLNASIKELINDGLAANDSISFVGRALFARFLVDRGLLTQASWPGAVPDELFDTMDNAAATCRWLDVTFNGNLLPLSDKAWTRLSANALHELGNIMRRAEGGQLSLGWSDSWDHLDFSHIPVGILSQAYEHCLALFDKKTQKKDASYYTPAPIAEMLTKAAFAAITDPAALANARVLDPAAGAGIFLINAFFEIVVAKWRFSGRRPDTDTLRSILYNQLTGLDVNESALRFSALGLYLAAIELDPSPEPVQKLKFDDLRKTTLRLVVRDDQQSKTKAAVKGQKPSREVSPLQLGSLGPAIGTEYDGLFDIVLGNPPWSKAPKKLSLAPVERVASAVVSERIGWDQPVPIPSRGLDIAFLWYAQKWAKPGGSIAFAMHARLLFLNNKAAALTRQLLFSAFDVQAVINGSDLRKTKVWTNINAQFCLVIGRNRPAHLGAGLRFISPRRESGLNMGGLMRIDPSGADLITIRELIEYPDIFKAVFRGSKNDLRLIRSIEDLKLPSLGSIWRRESRRNEGTELLSGNGYQTKRPSTTKLISAEELIGKPVLSGKNFNKWDGDVTSLPPFNLPFLHRGRDFKLFKGPILLTSKSPRAATKRILSLVSNDDVVFSENIYGWQLQNDRRGIQLGKYLSLVLGSKIALWICLMRGGNFGIERETIEMVMMKHLPVSEPSDAWLDISEKLYSDAVIDKMPGAWDKIDSWLAGSYGLNDRDMQVINDTLDFNLTFAAVTNNAEKPTTRRARQLFLDALLEELSPWFAGERKILAGSLSASDVMSTWQGISIAMKEENQNRVPPNLERLHRVADRLATTQIILEGKGGLDIARLNQARYWTVTQARDLAADIILSYLDTLQEAAA